jgi:intraflagellar transport protein 46
MMSNSSRADRIRRLLEDSKDDSSSASSNEEQPCPFDMPSTNQDLKEDDSSSTGERSGEDFVATVKNESKSKKTNPIHLPVSDENDLFSLIDNYKPVDLDIDTPLKCFLPSFVPTIGEVDPNLRVPRPDVIDDRVGLEVLDEPLPSAQSNQAVVELQLRNQLKAKRSANVRSLDAHSNPDAMDEWIQAVEEVHAATKTAPSKQNEMPNVEELMQPWPKEMEDALNSGEVFLPPADIDLSLEEYARTLCSLFQTVEERLVDSIHALMSLFAEYKDKETGKKSMTINVSEWS